MTTSADLRDLAVTALTNTTNAGASVYSPRTWPTWPNVYPVILVRTPEESGQSFGRAGPPAFTVTTTMEITARLQGPALPNDAGAVAVEAALETLREQIKAAVINYPALMSLLQQYSSFRSRITVTAEGEQPIGEVNVSIDMEFVQGPDDFFPVPVVPLEGVDVQIQMPSGTTQPGATIDLPQ